MKNPLQSTKSISHPFIRPDSLQERRYQLSLAMRALEDNAMIVLPTGLGKTAIALIVAASRLHNHQGKVLVLAPTKPLVEQHLRFFREFLLLPEEGGFAMFTGETAPDERKELWGRSTVCFATPQVVKNDVIAGRYDLRDVTLLVVDECHRAVGNYAYVFLANRYVSSAHHPLLLAITASPGGDRARVQEVCENLSIRIVETRTEDDEDVKPYVHDRSLEVVNVALPPELASALADLNELMDSRLQQLKKLNFIVPMRERLTMKALNAINTQIQKRIAGRDPSAFLAASIYAECMKLRHAISLAESQGSMALRHYLEKLGAEGASAKGTKASRRLARDPVFERLVLRSEGWQGELHPKMDIIVELVRKQLEAANESRIIIFATFRDTVQLLVDHLNAHGISCERFVGQATKDAEKGLTQKKQIEALQRFRAGSFKVLIATSVGEEGLDVPSTDMVIFYEAVPSEIRSIQRKGRTGRSGSGKIVVLVTKGTSDEVYRHISQRKERAMVDGMRSMSAQSPRKPQGVSGQQTLIDAFADRGPRIIVDDRETSSRVVEELSTLGADIELVRRDIGDYAIGDRIIVERKTTRDFLDTLVNRDLFGQIRTLAAAALRPVLIVEGENLFTIRDIHPNAIRGTLAAIAVDMGVTLLFTRNEEETAQMLYIIARREEEEGGEKRSQPHKSYRSLREQQESVIAAFPGIGLKNARVLLDHFGSIQALINAEREELVSIKGVGEKTADLIYDLSRRQYH